MPPRSGGSLAGQHCRVEADLQVTSIAACCGRHRAETGVVGDRSARHRASPTCSRALVFVVMRILVRVSPAIERLRSEDEEGCRPPTPAQNIFSRASACAGGIRGVPNSSTPRSSFRCADRNLAPRGRGDREAKSLMGQSRRLSDVGMSASPPTTDVSLRRSEPTLSANRRHCRPRVRWPCIRKKRMVLSICTGLAPHVPRCLE